LGNLLRQKERKKIWFEQKMTYYSQTTLRSQCILAGFWKEFEAGG